MKNKKSLWWIVAWNGTIKIHVTKTTGLFTIICIYINIYTNLKNLNATIVQVIYSQWSHLFEFLGLSLTDRWLDDMHLQLGQISCWDLQRELYVLAPLHRTWLHGWRWWKSAECICCLWGKQTVNSKYSNWGNQGEVTHISVKERHQ